MDPWYWTIDEVVRNLCHSRDLWGDRPGSSLPGAQDLEQTLRKNEINGATLLEGLDVRSLKEELGIKALGKRTAITYAIEKLRASSPRYISHRATISSYQQRIDDQANNLSPAPTPPPRTMPIDQKHSPTIQSASSTSARAGEILIQPINGGRKRRKLQLGPENNVLQVPKTKESPDAYLGKAKTFLDDIFYNGIVDEDSSADELTDDISIFHPNLLFPGRQRFVNKRLYHFLQSNVTRLDDSCLVLHPYPQNLVKPGNGRSVMLFKAVHGKVKVTKEDALLLDRDLENVSNAVGRGNENHDWDFLIKYTKNNGNEAVLPLLGESGSENEYEGSLLEEYETEERERMFNLHQHGQYLSKDMVDAAIDNAIVDLEQNWIEEKLPLRQAKAWSVWRKAQGRDRYRRIDESRHELERLDSRLMRLRSSICDEVWKTTAAIHKQCACMELSVSQRQDALWRLKLWAVKQPPSRQHIKNMSGAGKPHIHESDEDDEVLDTDSEEMDDLVDIDDVMDGNFGEISQQSIQSSSPSDTLEKSNHLPSLPPGLPALLPSTINSYDGVIPLQNMSSLVSMQVDSDSAESADEDNPGMLLDKQAQPEGSEIFTSMTIMENEDLEGKKQLNNSQLRPQGMYLDDITMVGKPQNVVDLTEIPSSPPDVEVVEVSKKVRAPRFSNTPETDSEEQIEDWTWEELEELNDRKRLVLRLLHFMDAKLSTGIKRHFWRVNQLTLKDELLRGLGTIQRNETTLLGIDKEMFPKVINSAKLLVCWETCNHRYLRENPISHKIVKDIIKRCSRENFEPFYNFIHLLAKFSADESDSEGEPVDKVSPRKGRKRGVRKSRAAQELRHVAQHRRIEGEARQQELKLQFKSSGLSTEANGIIINITKEAHEDLIYINPHIGSRLKSHQIDGVRFMWRELVTVGSSAMQGCLLAHTMGLGKTIQT